MTDGIYINGKRPVSKKAVKDSVNAGVDIEIESTSMFGGYSGPLSGAHKGATITFVGPDPHNNRKFYGNIKWNSKKNSWTVI
jgi:hypothetical protein